jgi:hypothetical protein
MQKIKSFLFTLTGLFILVTLLSLPIPSVVKVERGVEIHRPAAWVFDEIGNLHNWSQWQPFLRDGAEKITFSADSTAINSFCDWERNGKRNRFVLTRRNEMEVTVALRREGENDVVSTIKVLPLSDSNSVQVSWVALTKLKWYPWEKFYGIFIEKFTGQGYEDALNGLKQYAERH